MLYFATRKELKAADCKVAFITLTYITKKLAHEAQIDSRRDRCYFGFSVSRGNLVSGVYVRPTYIAPSDLFEF